MVQFDKALEDRWDRKELLAQVQFDSSGSPVCQTPLATIP